MKSRGPQFYGDIHKNASAIIRLGLQGKHIGILGNNSYDLLVNFCAVLYTGSIAIVISKDYTPAEIKTYGSLSDLDALIYDPEFEENCLNADLGIKLISITTSSSNDILSMESEREKGLLEIRFMALPNAMAAVLPVVWMLQTLTP